MEEKKFTSGKTVFQMVLIAVVVIQTFPLIWLLDFSLASSNEMFTNSPLVISKVIKRDNYVRALMGGHFPLCSKNSLLINALVMAAVLVTSIMASFTCTGMYWKLSGMMGNLILLGMMVPIHATLLPNYVIYDKLHLIGSIWALLIPYIAFSLPQGLFLTSSFMDSIPRGIEEVAMIDGCRIYRMIAVLITPMPKSSLMTVSIMTLLNNWNEFTMAGTYLSSSRWKTLSFSALELTGMYSSSYAVQFAVIVLTAIPMVIIYIILSKHITKGVAMGAIKG